MSRTRIAYMPLATYPETVSDGAIVAAINFAGPLACALHVTTFTVDIPQMSSPLGSILIDIPGLVHTAEEKSKAEARRQQKLVEKTAAGRKDSHCTHREVVLGAVLDAASAEARYFDFALLPWSGDTRAARDMAETVIFGSGRPAVLVPETAKPALFNHIAVAWDASRVAARALGDALPLLATDGRVSVLTVKDEKPLGRPDLAASLASQLMARGYKTEAVDIKLGGRKIAEALQDEAISAGANLLAIGGFGHSRLRDFILGGATEGILSDLRIPALLSH
jgi:nucleotide-binding universal stress UspA family protein